MNTANADVIAALEARQYGQQTRAATLREELTRIRQRLHEAKFGTS